MRSLSALLVLACAGGLVGCDSSDDPTLKIESAARDIEQLPITGTPDERSGAYQRVSSSLNDVKSDRDGASAPAAQVIAAQADAGVAQIELEKAMAESARLIAGDKGETPLVGALDIRVRMEQYERTEAAAQAYAAQDLSDQFAEIDDAARRISDALSAARSRLAGIDTSIADLEQERDQRNAKARGLRAEFATLMSSIEGASATERQPVMKEAREIGRRADRLEVEAGEYQIEIDDARSERRLVEGEVSLYESQKERNEQAREELRRVQNQLRQDRDDLRAEVRRQGDELRDAYTTLIGLYEQGAMASFEQAANALSRAASQSNSGGNKVQGGRTSEGGIRVLEASALVSRATVETTFADLGADLIAVLDEAGDLRGRVDAMRQRATDAMMLAAEAYDGASSVLDDAAERAQAIRDSLGQSDADAG